MRIFDYTNRGGRNLILDYIESLDDISKEAIFNARELISIYGMQGLNSLNCRKLYKKIYELKIKNHRLAYFIKDDSIYFIHIFKKQKNKTEQIDMNIIKKRYNTLFKGE